MTRLRTTLACVAALAMLAIAVKADPAYTIVAGGLSSPRGLTFAPGGRYRIPDSIRETRESIVFGVTTPAPVFTLMPGILYFADITHWSTGTKPWR